MPNDITQDFPRSLPSSLAFIKMTLSILGFWCLSFKKTPYIALVSRTHLSFFTFISLGKLIFFSVFFSCHAIRPSSGSFFKSSFTCYIFASCSLTRTRHHFWCIGLSYVQIKLQKHGSSICFSAKKCREVALKLANLLIGRKLLLLIK